MRNGKKLTNGMRFNESFGRLLEKMGYRTLARYAEKQEESLYEVWRWRGVLFFKDIAKYTNKERGIEELMADEIVHRERVYLNLVFKTGRRGVEKTARLGRKRIEREIRDLWECPGVLFDPTYKWLGIESGHRRRQLRIAE